MLNFEIEKAVDFYNIPIIVAYTGYDYILNPGLIKQKCITAAISQFSVNNKEDQLTLPLNYYNEEAYKQWGYKD